MQKFLNIPVTSKGNNLLSANNITSVETFSATKTNIYYGSGKVASLTHASISTGAFVTALLDKVQECHATPWTTVSISVDNLPVAVSAIALTL